MSANPESGSRPILEQCDLCERFNCLPQGCESSWQSEPACNSGEPPLPFQVRQSSPFEPHRYHETRNFLPLVQRTTCRVRTPESSRTWNSFTTHGAGICNRFCCPIQQMQLGCEFSIYEVHGNDLPHFLERVPYRPRAQWSKSAPHRSRADPFV